MKNVFDKNDNQEFINRINHLTAQSQPVWGKMNVAQMLAHCCVSYELVYENKHPKPKPLLRFFLKTFVKKYIVNEEPYKQSLRTAPEFLITDERIFEKEKQRLIEYITKTQDLGASYFDKRESNSFGVLTITEWNNMFAKHLNHHLKQFGV
jgi:Protein of unknown function (DUF1569)